MTFADRIYEQVKELPEPLAREVLAFIDSLHHRQAEADRCNLMDAQAKSLASVWDNPEDKVWDDA